ncbi:MAG: hypothetical protein LKJ03_02305 [Enterococcaceae bacterium]|nr:hypothetical protein [Enterococcaceae bacterium]MCI1918657.1 hypothetical protein [Enterococcaceae bacterium]
MRVYNRKMFLLGILTILVGLASLATLFVEMQVTRLLIAVFVIFIGLEMILRSLSEKQTRSDQKAEKRNRAVTLRSRALASDVTRWTSFVLTPLSLGIGVYWQIPLLIGVGLGAALFFNLSMLTEMIAVIRYSK